MNQNDVNRLENYKEIHKHRVYYPNRCNYCFSVRNLKKCGYCKAVNYCCKKHQKDDWPFHKPTCIAFKEIKAKLPPPENCDENTFCDYRLRLLLELLKLRSLTHSSYLTEYERQICLLPMVCMVCFKKPSKKYRCKLCQCVDYCSEEHKKSDASTHDKYCGHWWWCRIVNSSFYPNGYKLHGVILDNTKIKIPKSQKWPEHVLLLFGLIEETVWFKNEEPTNAIENMNEFFQKIMLIDPYIPAAIIINLLEKSKFIINRQLITKSHKRNAKMTRDGTNLSLEKNSTMVVHFAVADDTELKFDWNKIFDLLTEWLFNIKRIHIVLTNPNFKKCDLIVPSFRYVKNVKVTVIQKAYKEVNDLPKPDVIVLLECNRYFKQDMLQKLNEKEHKMPFFKYPNIPVVFCDGGSFELQEIINFLSQFSDIECIVPYHCSHYRGIRTTRIWTREINAYYPNEYCTVFQKK